MREFIERHNISRLTKQLAEEGDTSRRATLQSLLAEASQRLRDLDEPDPPDAVDGH